MMNPQQMRKIRQIQQEIMKAQEAVSNAEFTKVEIDETFTIDSKEDTEMLGEMIVAAYNAAHVELEKFTEEKLGKYQSMLGGSFF